MGGIIIFGRRSPRLLQQLSPITLLKRIGTNIWTLSGDFGASFTGSTAGQPVGGLLLTITKAS